MSQNYHLYKNVNIVSILLLESYNEPNYDCTSSSHFKVFYLFIPDIYIIYIGFYFQKPNLEFTHDPEVIWNIIFISSCLNV